MNIDDLQRVIEDYLYNSLTQKDFDKAVENITSFLNDAVDKESEGIAYALLGALIAKYESSEEKAMQKFAKALELDNNCKIYYYRGEAYFNLGLYDKALKDFSYIIKEHDDVWYFYNSRGNTYTQLNKFTEAIRDYDSAISLEASNHSSHNGKGNILYKQGKFKESLEEINTAIRLSPRNEQYYKNRILTYTALNKLDNALIDINEVLNFTTDKDYFYNLQLNIVKQELKNEMVDQLKLKDETIESIKQNINALELKNKSDKKLNELTNLAKEFSNRVFWHQVGKGIFLFILLILTCLIVTAILSSINNKAYLGIKFNEFSIVDRYSLLTPILFLEFLCIKNYFRNLKHEAFYQHNKAVILSIERIKSTYFNLENSEEKKQFREFVLEQYKELYKSPLLVDKNTFFVKRGSNEIKMD